MGQMFWAAGTLISISWICLLPSCHDDAGRKEKAQQHDGAVSCGAAGLHQKTFTFLWLLLFQSAALHASVRSVPEAAAVTHFLYVFNHSYGTWWSRLQLMSCHHCD